MRHHRSVPRRTAALVPALCLVLTGCLRLEAPAPDADLIGAAQQALLTLEPGEADASVRLEPACPPADPEAPLTAEDLNEAFQELDLPYWKQSDVGASAVLSDGRVLWVWGDTVRQRGTTPRLTDNSILVSSGTCVSQLLTDDTAQVLPRDPGELSTWPLSVLRMDPRPGDPADVTDVVVVFASRVQPAEGQFAFLERGTTVGVYTVGGDGVPRLVEARYLTPDDPDLGAIHWGAGSTVDGDWAYLYGTRDTSEPMVYGRELFVSRLPIDQIVDGEALEYWDGATWQPDPDRAAPIMGAVEGPAQRLSVDVVDGQWMLFSKLGGDLANVAAVWTSDSPTGPFTAEKVLDAPFEIPDDTTADVEDKIISYMPLAHPEIPTDPGTMIVSVSRNLTNFAELLRTPERAVPLFSQVPRP
jgi:hypothetical protein